MRDRVFVLSFKAHYSSKEASHLLGNLMQDPTFVLAPPCRISTFNLTHPIYKDEEAFSPLFP